MRQRRAEDSAKDETNSSQLTIGGILKTSGLLIMKEQEKWLKSILFR